MNYYTEKQIFYIDSHNRNDLVNESNSDFTYTLDVDPNIDFDRVVLLDASIPKSHYIVTAGNNTFDVVENLGAGDLTRTITMPIGNYNRQSFDRVLTTLLNDNPNTYVYTITYDNINRTQDTGKYTYSWTNVDGNAQEPKFVVTTHLHEQLGFEKNSTNTFVAGSLVSTHVQNFRPESTMYILSDICQNRNNNILANIISAGEPDFYYIVYYENTPNEKSKTYSGNKSNTFRFTITDEEFNKIDLNGINCVFTIMLYKENNIGSLIKGYIKLKTLKESTK